MFVSDNTPFYSVVIPAYNRASVIGNAIASVRAQTYQDFEIVVVDDGSTDDPLPVLEAFGDPRIRYIRQQNGGGAAARNRGIDNARGQFIAFLDSDDCFLPDHLQAMHAIVGQQANVVGYAQVVVDRHNGSVFLKPPRAMLAGESMAEYLCCARGFVQTSALVVPTILARRVRYRTGLPFGQDTDFAIRLAFDGGRFVMAEKPGAIWNDGFDPHRVSSFRKGVQLLPWIEEMRTSISPKAYHGYRGWHVAKGIATTDRLQAFRLYLAALSYFCYSPSLAIVIFCQIFVPDAAYRRWANLVIQLIGKRKKSQA